MLDVDFVTVKSNLLVQLKKKRLFQNSPLHFWLQQWVQGPAGIWSQIPPEDQLYYDLEERHSLMSIRQEFLNEDIKDSNDKDVYGEREAFARKEPEGWSQWPAIHHNQEGGLVWKNGKRLEKYIW